MAEVEAERRGSSVTIWINRPAARNAIALSTMDALQRTLDQVTAEEVSVLILRGAGERVFVSGGDLKELATLRTVDEATAMARQMRHLLDRLASLEMPTIAAINGHALGGGAEVALACDLRLAVEEASLAFNQAQLAIMPAWGGVERLVALVGRSAAMEMLLTRDRMSAAHAESIGLVNRTFARSDFDGGVQSFALEIAQLPATVARAIKSTVTAAEPNTHPNSEEDAVRAFAQLWAADEHWSAVDRFLTAYEAARKH